MDKYIPLIVAILSLLGNLLQLLKGGNLKKALEIFVRAIEYARPTSSVKDGAIVELDVREAIKDSIERAATAAGLEKKIVAPIVDKVTGKDEA